MFIFDIARRTRCRSGALGNSKIGDPLAPTNVRDIFAAATHGSPFIRRGMLKEGDACLAPTNEERTPDARILGVGFSGR